MLILRGLGGSQFHDEIIHPVLLTYVIQHTGVRMIQAGDGLCFAFETLLANGIRGELRGKNFDGDGAVQARVPRAIDLSPAARGPTTSYGPRLLPAESITSSAPRSNW